MKGSFVASKQWFVKKITSFKLLDVFKYNTPHRQIKLFWELKSVKSFCPDNLWKLQQKQSKSQSCHKWETKKSAWIKSLLNSRNKRIGFPFVSFILAAEKSKCVSGRILGTNRMEMRRKSVSTNKLSFLLPWNAVCSSSHLLLERILQNLRELEGGISGFGGLWKNTIKGIFFNSVWHRKKDK